MRRRGSLVGEKGSVAASLNLMQKMLFEQSSRVAARSDLLALEVTAKQRAVESVKARFQELSDLTQPGHDVEAYEQEVRQKLAAASAVLDQNYAAHDARVQRILKRVDESSRGVHGIKSGFRDLQAAVTPHPPWRARAPLC